MCVSMHMNMCKKKMVLEMEGIIVKLTGSLDCTFLRGDRCIHTKLQSMNFLRLGKHSVTKEQSAQEWIWKEHEPKKTIHKQVPSCDPSVLPLCSVNVRSNPPAQGPSDR